MKDNHKADVSHTDEFNKMYQEMVKQAEDKYKVKSEHPKTEEEAKDFAAKVLKIKEEIIVPDNCEAWDDQGNVISTSKIIIREKKKEYPKTYEECAKVLLDRASVRNDLGYKGDLLVALQRLLVCRDAYWKIAGDWKPDYDSGVDKLGICTYDGVVQKSNAASHWERHLNKVLEFPTKEMRDAFMKNFDPDIEFCKELL